MQLITDLDAIRRLTAEKWDEFEVMGYMLELYEDISDAEIDALVEQVAAPIREAIDCTQCGNCCRSLQVHLTREDVATLSAGIHITPDEIETQYLTTEGCAEIGEWARFKDIPCRFLADSRCTVYPHRPETCRAYPELTAFRWLIDTYIEGAQLCPIIYNTLVAMVDEVDKL
jgi:Fe-S-cluster containining protein